MKRRTKEIGLDEYLAGLTNRELLDISAERFFSDPAHPPEVITAAERLLDKRGGS